MEGRIKVDFFGREYSVVTDADEDYVLKIVKYLEQKVTEAAEEGVPITASPPVFLASLEIVDDFFELRREFDEFKRNAERKTEELAGLLEPGAPAEKQPAAAEQNPEDPFRSRGNRS